MSARTRKNAQGLRGQEIPKDPRSARLGREPGRKKTRVIPSRFVTKDHVPGLRSRADESQGRSVREAGVWAQKS